MKSKFVIFNVIVFLIFIILFNVGASQNSNISYGFSGNSWLNPVNVEYYNFEGIILEIFSLVGILIQLIFVNYKLIRDKK